MFLPLVLNASLGTSLTALLVFLRRILQTAPRACILMAPIVCLRSVLTAPMVEFSTDVPVSTRRILHAVQVSSLMVPAASPSPHLSANPGQVGMEASVRRRKPQVVPPE